jgi:hypothetical protein
MPDVRPVCRTKFVSRKNAKLAKKYANKKIWFFSLRALRLCEILIFSPLQQGIVGDRRSE